MQISRTIQEIWRNEAVMRSTCHYFLVMFAIYCVQDFYFMILKDIVKQDSSKAIFLNLTAFISFPVSLTISVLIKLLDDHKLILVIQISLYIGSLIIECIIYKRYSLFWAIVSSILYNVGQGTVFTTMDLMKINALSLTGSLHLISIANIGASLGQMGGLLMGIILSYLEKDPIEMRQKLRYVSVLASCLCIYMVVSFSPKCDFSENTKVMGNEKVKRSIGSNIRGVLKLMLTPSYAIFITGLLCQCAVQKNIKFFQRDYIIKMGASEIGASVGQFINRGLTILCYSAVVYITSENMIFKYFLVSCIFGTFRAFFFIYIGKQRKFTSLYQTILIILFSVEDGFQNLSISRICNYLSPGHLKVYSMGVYTGTKNSLSIVLSTLLTAAINKSNKDITEEIYRRIWIYMSGLALISFLFSAVLIILNRVK
ncbi:hypothetical protein CDIK_1110 [Cucumispora dikerogammari]|nr:hypothetical protein CDIK_1110 [Cucumispora dikerogammari]